MVQWLGLCAFTAEGPGSIPGRGTKIPQAGQCGQHPPPKKRKEKERKPHTHYYRLSVSTPPQIHMLKPDTQGDGIRTRSL